MKDGLKIEAEDDIVVVVDGDNEVYSGLEDYEPMKNEDWKFIKTTGDKGYYEFCYNDKVFHKYRIH